MRIVVTGTGTSVGKTHVTCALVGALRRRTLRVVALKPIETGWTDGEGSDGHRLGSSSEFHVKQPLYTFVRSVSPHLAARDEGIAIEIGRIVEWVGAIGRPEADVAVIETAGGLFTPLSDRATNADLAGALEPDVLLLVGPDRLGILHDVGSAAIAAGARGLAIAAVALSAPREADASTGRNAEEIERLALARRAFAFPRAPVEDAATRAAADRLAQFVLSERAGAP